MKLYYYDHCPYCVRARMIFGLHGVPVEEAVLANDDEQTPIAMIGAKQLPILQKDDSTFMGESLDIVRYVDETAGKGRLNEAVRQEVQAWFDEVGAYYNKLTWPRMIKTALPEFAAESAVKYFTDKKERVIGSFAANLNKTAQYLERINADLQTLAALKQAGEGMAGETGMEDILVFPLLRNLTIVRGIEWPSELADYVAQMSEKTGVPLYFDRAL